MKKRFTAVLLSALVLALPVNVFGLAGPIGSPQLAHRADLPAEKRDQVLAFLKYLRENLDFIEGNFINEFTYQRLGGTAANTATSIKKAKTIGIWDVHVQFRDFGEQTTAFSLSQDASANTVTFIVNAGRDDFLLKHFLPYLPGLKTNIASEKEK